MSLLFIDGFDHYSTSDLLKKWSNVGSSTIVNNAGRRGGGAFQPSYNGSASKNLSINTSSIICGFALKCAAASATSVIFVVSDASTNQVYFNAYADGSIGAFRGNGTLLGMSLPGILISGIYQYLEFKILISSTNGSVVVRVNGATVLNLTNKNTQQTANASISNFIVGYFGSFQSAYIDDLYVCDFNGTYNNDFLGDCRIDVMYANGPGTYSQFTAASGANWTNVSNSTPNLTNYVSTSIIGNKDSYIFSDLPTAGTVIAGIQISNAALKDDNGFRSISNLIRSGTTDLIGPAQPLSISQLFYSTIVELNPVTTAPWTQDAVNNVEAGTVLAA